MKTKTRRIKWIDGVKVICKIAGYTEYQIPSGMTGSALEEWRKDNEEEIANFKKGGNE